MKGLFLIVIFELCTLFTFSQNLKRDHVIERVHVSLAVIREECRKNTFSFCGDGIEQPYRVTSLIIPFDTANVLLGYDSAVYILSLSSQYDSLVDNDFSIEKRMQTDSIFNVLATKQNEICIYDEQLKKIVNSYYKHNRVQNKFDGFLKFHVYLMSADVKYIGEKEIFMPNFLSKSSNRLVKRIKYKCYIIANVNHIDKIQYSKRYIN